MKKILVALIVFSSAQSFARVEPGACTTTLMNKYFGTVFSIASDFEYVNGGYGFYLAYKNIDGYHINGICVMTDMNCKEISKSPVTAKGCW